MSRVHSRVRPAIPIALVAIALVSCGRSARPREKFPDLDVLFGDEQTANRVCHPAVRHAVKGQARVRGCTFASREVTAFGGIIPREPTPETAVCPIRVVPAGGDRLIVEPLVFGQSFDSLPFLRCPDGFWPVARHVVKTDEGYLVSEVGIEQGQLVWTDPKGENERRIARGRFVGFARAPSGAILTLGVGRAHLGRGAVLRLDRSSGGTDWRAELIAVLPVTPTTTAFDDHGTLIGYAERFVFRVDETGRVENLFYVSRDLGYVASIARTNEGTVYLGVECGVLKVTANGEEWWSAHDGASGQWTSCAQ